MGWCRALVTVFLLGLLISASAQTPQSRKKPTTAPPPQPAAAAPAPPPPATLRFDGLYQKQGSSGAFSYFRFYDDGTVVETLDTQGAAEKVARWLNKGSDAKGQYTLQGAKLEFTTVAPWGSYSYSATVDKDRLIVRYLGGKQTDPEEYRFVPVAADALQEKPIQEGASLVLEFAGAAAGTKVTVTMGQSQDGDGCPFTPFPGKPRYSSGTKRLAYQVSIDPPPLYRMNIGVRMEVACMSPSTRDHRCNQFAIVGGQPVNNRWTSVVSCSDGGPFKSGKYKLKVLDGEVALKQMEFEVE